MVIGRLSPGIWIRRVLGTALGVVLLTGVLGADGPVASIEQRLSGADSVVVATARNVSAEWRRNAYGDRLIVSRVLLQVEETLKGATGQSLWLEVDGGTLDGFTLRVSGLALLRPGDRGVFFLDKAEGTVRKPFLRGQGILQLDDQNMVQGSTLGLNEIRGKARGMGR